LRELHRDEVVFWIEVVFAGLIDDSHLTVPGGTVVGQKAVELTQFE